MAVPGDEDGASSNASRSRRSGASSSHSNEPVDGVWTPNTDQWGSEAGMGTGGAGAGTGTTAGAGSGTAGGGSGVQTVLSSRRSSLRSTSILELEGMTRPNSPGPAPTEDPLEGISTAESTTGAGSSKPEVVVTKAARRDQSVSPRPEGDTSKLQAEDAQKIWNLLPVYII